MCHSNKAAKSYLDYQLNNKNNLFDFPSPQSTCYRKNSFKKKVKKLTSLIQSIAYQFKFLCKRKKKGLKSSRRTRVAKMLGIFLYYAYVQKKCGHPNLRMIIYIHWF